MKNRKGLRLFAEFDIYTWVLGGGLHISRWSGKTWNWDFSIGVGPLCFGIEWNRA